MKRVIAFVTVSVLAISFAIYMDFRETNGSHDASNRTYDKGYEEGRESGYNYGVEMAQEYIDFQVEDDIHSLEFDIEDKYGIYPEEAIIMLEHYADGEPVSKAELNNAIWAISEYYYDSLEIAYGIDDYDID